jgi:hypothetical protein
MKTKTYENRIEITNDIITRVVEISEDKDGSLIIQFYSDFTLNVPQFENKHTITLTK